MSLNVPDSEELEFFYFVKSYLSFKQQKKKILIFTAESKLSESPHIDEREESELGRYCFSARKHK